MDEGRFSDEKLHAWVDGETGLESEAIASEVNRCARSRLEVESVRITGEYLRESVQHVGEVEPLVALQNIRKRIEEADAIEKAGIRGRLTLAWRDLWVSKRRALTGLACAAALGALVAPGAMWMLGDFERPERDVGIAQSASVIVESVEIEGSAKTVLFQPQGSDTAVIWIDTDEDVYEEKF